MFGFLKRDPSKRLQQKYNELRLKARDLQRNGDIRQFAVVSAEAEELSRQLDALQQVSDTSR